MTTYDATSLNDFRRCPALWQQRHGLGLVKVYDIPDAADAGAAWHVGMRAWFGAPTSELALPLAQAALLKAWGEEPLLESALPNKRPRGLYEAMLRTYAEKWPRERDGFEVVRNEEWCEATIVPHPGSAPAQVGELSFPQAPTFSYGGIVDRLIRLDGANYVMDTKTTALYLNDAFFASYELSTQLRGYVALELVLGRECEGAYIDAVHVDTRSQKPKPEHFVRWGPIRYDQQRLSAWARDAERTIGEIERYLREEGLDSRWEQRDLSCRAWGKLCSYWDRCSVAPELVHLVPGYKEEPWRPNERT